MATAAAYTMVESPFQMILREAGQKVLSDCAEKVRKIKVAFDTKLIVIESTRQRICDVINKEASSWRHGFSHLLLGSVAEGVIRLATKPVLIIRGVEVPDRNSPMWQ